MSSLFFLNLQEFIFTNRFIMSLKNLSEIQEGLTYDDVLLVPSYSEVLPREVQLKSLF